jgi:hypothetical protein
VGNSDQSSKKGKNEFLVFCMRISYGDGNFVLKTRGNCNPIFNGYGKIIVFFII